MIKPFDFLSLADDLEEQCPEENEALMRTVVSRAYYAAFHEAMAYYKKNGKSFLGQGYSHQAFLSEMERSGKKELRRISKQLNELKQNRVEADYALEKNINAYKVKKSIKLSKKIFKNLSDLSSNSISS